MWPKNKPKNRELFFLVLGIDVSDSAQEFFLALCSGVTSGKAHRTICDDGDLNLDWPYARQVFSYLFYLSDPSI